MVEFLIDKRNIRIDVVNFRYEKKTLQIFQQNWHDPASDVNVQM